MGNPVVAGAASGVRDVVRDGENGYLTGEDEEEWAGRIMRLTEDDARRFRMGRTAAETAKRYSEDEVAGIAEQCYRRVCVSRPGQAEDMRSIPGRYVI